MEYKSSFIVFFFESKQGLELETRKYRKKLWKKSLEKTWKLFHKKSSIIFFSDFGWDSFFIRTLCTMKSHEISLPMEGVLKEDFWKFFYCSFFKENFKVFEEKKKAVRFRFLNTSAYLSGLKANEWFQKILNLHPIQDKLISWKNSYF